MAAASEEPMDLTTNMATTTSVHQHYEILAVDPNTAIPQHCASGTKDSTVSVKESTTTSPVLVRAMTPMERYNEMIDDLPEVPSSSSSSQPSAKFSTDTSSSSNGGVAKIMKSMGPTSQQAWQTAKPKQV